MGTIKIELDIPNFEKELELKVILNKDGVQTSTPLVDGKTILQPYSQVVQQPCNDSGSAWKQKVDGVASAASTMPPTQAAPKTTHGIPSSMMGNF